MMRTKIHECEQGKGTIVYRLPLIDEMSAILAEFQRIKNLQDEIEIIKGSLEFSKKLIISIDIDYDGEHIDSYEKLNEFPEFFSDLMAITNKISNLSFPSLESSAKKKR